jgi:hypothetical protein
MSESINKKIEPVLVQDRRLNFTGEGKFGVIKSGIQNTFIALTTSSYSNNSITFNAQPPSPSIAVNREIFMQIPFSITFTGTAGASGTLLDLNGGDAPRFMPLNQIIQVISVTINNATVTQNNYQVINPLLRTNISDFDYKTNLSLAPSMPDFYQNYDDNIVNGWGVVNDPLQNIGQTSQGWQTRGGWDLVFSNPNVGAGNPATATVSFVTTEPMILSPFLTGTDDHKALIGIQTLQVNLTLGNLQRVWSHSALNGDNGTISSISVNIGGTGRFSGVMPALLLNYITPPEIDTIPDEISYSYQTLTPYSTNIPTSVPGGTSGSITINNIQFSTIPRRIYVFVSRQNVDLTFLTSDVYARIDSLNINFDNQTGILGGATSQQLYQMSVNSGLNMTWLQWSLYTGSVMIIDVGRTLMLSKSTDAPSLETTKQFSVTIGYTNLNTNSVALTATALVINDGLLTVAGNSCYLQNSVLSAADILNAKESGKVEAYERATNFYGGAFFNSFKKAAKKVLKHVNQGLKESKVVSTALANVHPALGHAASFAGYGRPKQRGGAVVGGRRVNKQALLEYQ